MTNPYIDDIPQFTVKFDYAIVKEEFDFNDYVARDGELVLKPNSTPKYFVLDNKQFNSLEELAIYINLTYGNNTSQRFMLDMSLANADKLQEMLCKRN